jgi:hypothetical protein
MQYSDYVLDHLIAPKLTSLTACGAAEVPALANYDTMFARRRVFGCKVSERQCSDSAYDVYTPVENGDF